MELKEFISTSLTQIVEGIRAAQSGPDGDHIGARGHFDGRDAGIYSGGTSGDFTVVAFDVAVSAETSEGGGTVRVAGMESTGEQLARASHESRIKFSVHLRLPEGGDFTDRGGGRQTRYNTGRSSY
ncbi:hypothetical protein KHC28_01395 [Ancylobacter sonchi]|uniref:hypothetical protein n=1 Tax=Ancylobacter sonchi TaxID=1937790 RepID=UPI001BD3A0D1|nr:hypothetical protein [Ancylobacter sonchi]MBS7532307.1 hypothetical protein [Ancylobacter sonchi]